MTISPDQYELPGTFYLGREYDLSTKELLPPLVLYDSRDLVTHGVVLGMTGSGKTGLCLALLEEAAMDGIPLIAVDPKGDIGNALLTFPDLSPESFLPWVNPDDARRKGVSVEEHAAAQAALWKKGLADWGEDGDRIRRLRDTVDMAIYTPGSNAGIPVSILSSLEVPPQAVLEDSEALMERIESTVTSLLGLTGVERDPVQSPEHVLLANIVSHVWSAGENLSLERLIHLIQQPPFQKIGVVDVNTFIAENARRALAMKVNSMIAAPGFANWLKGEPLDIQRMFYTPSGKPRIAIFSIAHLSDSERMFFVSLLLNQLLGWMRSQQGTTSLRALFYMDEIYGYLPPTAMPPSKKPMLLLLKQARAFGLGLLLATQNPVDLDYKALSNIGTWWLGRLQTERDRARVLAGLEGTNAGVDRAELDGALAGLSNRVFVMNNVHESALTPFHVRWVMSYMAGPMAREQIQRVMQGRTAEGRDSEAESGAAEDDFLPPPAATPASASAVRPGLPDGASEYFLEASNGGSQVVYAPAIIRSAAITLDDPKKGLSGTAFATVVNGIDSNGKVNWSDFLPFPRDLNPATLTSSPAAAARFGELPGATLKSATWSALSKDFVDWVAVNHSVEVRHAPALGVHAAPGEAEDEFRARIAQLARERRDAAVDELREKTARDLATLEARAARASTKVETQRSQASSARLSAALQIGESLLGSLMGRKTRGSPVKVRHINSATRVQREAREAAAAESELAKVREDIGALERKLADETEALRERFDPTTLVVEKATIRPLKKNIRVAAVGVLWIPAEQG